MHPFLEGVAPLAAKLGGTLVDGSELIDGDIPLYFGGALVGGYRAGGLQGALDRLIEQIEREVGCPLPQLDRQGKQDVVRRLDELGAFNLRKAVEDIADRLEVSRFTVYNYLNSTTREPSVPRTPTPASVPSEPPARES